jgi:hypothetical protein
MKIRHSLLSLLLLVVIISATSGCNLLGKGKTGQTGGDQQQQQQQQQQSAVDMTGDWEVAFLFGEKTMKSTLRLQQQGNEFSGEGADEDTGRAFQVQEGTVDNGQVFFKKFYPGSDPNTAGIEYAGTVKIVNDQDYKGPYMQGEYTTLINGQEVKGQWEGQKMQQQAPPQTSGAPEAPAPAAGSDKAPDLSGKWKVGYEYNFKTITSTMYLEQDGGKLIGHGVDSNTKEKFTVEKGWYNFPKVTLIRHYAKGKGAAAERRMTFKAQVENVRDKDYQGPYMSGKTEGGGAWEAQMVK